MSDVLVVYATVEGQSRKIAEHVCDHVVRACRIARVVDAAHAPADLDPAAFDAVIVVAPVHMARHHQAAVHFIRDHADTLQKRPGALISVSLHAVALDPADMDEARGYADELAAETGWLPAAVHYAAGALKFARYDFFKRWMMRRIATEKGLPTDSDEIEFTDWRALDDFVDDFLHAHAPVGA